MGAEAAGGAMQALGMVGEGVGAYQSLNEANKQAKLLINESSAEADRRKRETEKFMSSQESAYAKSGVILEGSPLLVLEETRQMGLAERQAIRAQGREQASTLVRQGRNRLMGALLFPSGAGKMGDHFGGMQGQGKATASAPNMTSGERMTFAGNRQYLSNESY